MSTQQLDNIISSFDPILLEEINESALMNRVDTKFLITFQQLLLILPKLSEHYRILNIDGLRTPQYESDYYDNQSLRFYLDHHRQKVDRFKVRYRKYVESDLTFLEVKHKSKGRTNKIRRVVTEIPTEMPDEHKDFVKSTGVQELNLKYILTNKFKRITLVGKSNPERLTFDTNLEYSGNNLNKTLDRIVIAELKQERLTRNSPFMKIVKQMQVRPFRVSKYCIGVIELYGKENVKYNRFKKKLLRINKLQVNAA